MSQTFHELSAGNAAGKNVFFSEYAGKVVLVVNTASKCGFTPQYEGLEALYKKYKDQGLVILGFPCDQFAHQEPGDNTEIQSFCKLNFGITFPVMGKVEVNGPGAHPVFVWLRQRAGGFLGNNVKWNFTKFLVGKDGKAVKRFSPTTEPKDLETHIIKALAA